MRSTEEQRGFNFGLLIGTGLGVLISVAVFTMTVWPTCRDLHDEAIKRGYAQYHPQTGRFTWVERSEK
jgi:hypothetical protein